MQRKLKVASVSKRLELEISVLKEKPPAQP